MSQPPGPSPDVRSLPAGEMTGAAFGMVAGLVGALLAVTAARGGLLIVLVPAQGLLGFAWLTLAAVPARVAGVGLAAAAGILADVLLLARPHPGAGALAGVIGLGVVAAVLGQLVRRDRVRVTDVIAAQCSAVILTVAPTALLAVTDGRRGDRVAAAALVAVTVGLAVAVAGRRSTVRDIILLPCSLLVGAGAGAGFGAALGAGVAGDPATVAGAVVGLLTVCAAAGVRAVGSGRAETAALTAAAPFALVGPAVYVVGRALLG